MHKAKFWWIWITLSISIEGVLYQLWTAGMLNSFDPKIWCEIEWNLVRIWMKIWCEIELFYSQNLVRNWMKFGAKLNENLVRNFMSFGARNLVPNWIFLVRNRMPSVSRNAPWTTTLSSLKHSRMTTHPGLVSLFADLNLLCYGNC